MIAAKSLSKLGHSYRKNVRGLPGSPDFANRRRRWAVFVHGCFWHQHPGCRRATIPKNNAEFWREKFAQNARRDEAAIRQLSNFGYAVAVIWECELDRVDEILSQFFETRRIDMS
jgi:DNA mismatch endonuclease Vsr